MSDIGGLQFLLTRRCVRSYTSDTVNDDDLQHMLNCMLRAPSASNAQAWAFVAVRNPTAIGHVRAFAPGIIGIPALVVVACLDRRRAGGKPGSGERNAGELCVAMAVNQLLLAAHVLGWGACPCSSFRSGPIGLLLGLPDHIEPVLLAAVGQPAQISTPSIRRKEEEVMKYERWS